jgi:hypothetical protein
LKGIVIEYILQTFATSSLVETITAFLNNNLNTLEKNSKLSTVYDKYAAPLYGVILRNLEDASYAPDILQKSFVEFYQSLKQEVTKGGVEFMTLYRITMRHVNLQNGTNHRSPT